VSIEYSSSVDHPIETVFAWHERPGAFERLTPPLQRVRLIEEARSLADGKAVIGLPGGIRWVAQHGGYDPPRRFVDDLVSLPVPWHHVHSLAPDGPTRTRITDSVATPIPSSLLRRMFIYRHTQVRDDLDVIAELRQLDPRARTVAVTGSSGLVGAGLCAFLSTAGNRVTDPPRPSTSSDVSNPRGDIESARGGTARVPSAKVVFRPTSSDSRRAHPIR
jgi:ligand-binding SRPBCC domain-containing protein